jgi:hypothetical protein
MAHLHSDMERFDIHIALEACDIVIESATIVAVSGTRFQDGKASAPLATRQPIQTAIIPILKTP